MILSQADFPGQQAVLRVSGRRLRSLESWPAEYDMAPDHPFPSGQGEGNSEEQRSSEATSGSRILFCLLNQPENGSVINKAQSQTDCLSCQSMSRKENFPQLSTLGPANA